MNPPKPVPSKNKLDAVSALFQQWRSQSVCRRTETPLELRTQAVALLQDYPRSHVVKALGINHTMLKQWQANPVAAQSSPAFIPLSVHRVSPPTACELALDFGNGSQATLRGDFSLAELTTLLRGLNATTESPT